MAISRQVFKRLERMKYMRTRETGKKALCWGDNAFLYMKRTNLGTHDQEMFLFFDTD